MHYSYVTKYFHVILTFASHLRDKQGNVGQSGVDVSKPAGYAVCDGNMSSSLVMSCDFMWSNVNLGSFGVSAVKRVFSLKML